MNVRTPSAIALRSEIAETMDELFAPPPGESVATLLAEYDAKRAAIDEVAEIFAGSLLGVVQYFIDGNTDRDSRYGSKALADKLFEGKGAYAALDAEYWDRVLKLTDVLDCMPQARRDEWFESIREHKTVTFDAPTVFGTLAELLASRQRFFAERVEGIFRSLSGNHVTNSPMGFRQRMILEYVTDQWSFTNSTRAGVISDLRKIIARFMGRDEPHYETIGHLIQYARRECTGEWVMVDGGALRLRCYKKGTAHLEVHPEIAYRLNNVLAYLHPTAIATEHRQRPTRKVREFELFSRPLPFAVIAVLMEMQRQGSRERIIGPGVWAVGYGWRKLDKHVRGAVASVMTSLGGVATSDHDGKLNGAFKFDYNVSSVLNEVITSGCIPDEKSHQFYPTPSSLARRVVALAEIGPMHTVLEPSAGQGGLARLLPNTRTTCVEVSPLHCEILRAQKFAVYEHDFLDWPSGGALPQFDRVVMNPPFQGRWLAHLEHAALMVVPGGRLVAVLPASAASRNILPGWSCVWSDAIEGAFVGTSMDVAILVAERPID
jgi:hypothetical protein